MSDEDTKLTYLILGCAVGTRTEQLLERKLTHSERMAIGLSVMDVLMVTDQAGDPLQAVDDFLLLSGRPE